MGIINLLLLLGCVDPSLLLLLRPDERMLVRQAGEENSFFVSCRGVPGLELDVVWKTAKRQLSGNTGHRVHIEPSVDGGKDLVFRRVEQEDEGRYTCSQGAETKYFDLVVVQPLDFNHTPSIQMVKMFDPNFRLRCSASGFPYPSITWKVKGKNIRNSLESPDSTSKYAMDGTDLLIRNVNKSDEGRYLCKAVQTVYAEDGLSVLYSDFKDFIINLKIEQEPEWNVNGSGQFYGFVTGTAKLTCEAAAQPPPTFSWLDAQNSPVAEGTTINTENMSTLILQIGHHNVFGAYTCIAQNIHGRKERVVMLSEGSKPETPKILPKRIFGNSLELEIMATNSDLFLKLDGFQVEVKNSTDDWKEAKLIEFDLEERGVYDIHGLNQETLYHVRARSRNLAGFSDPSNIIYLKTNGDIQPPAMGSQISGASSCVHRGYSVHSIQRYDATWLLSVNSDVAVLILTILSCANFL